MGRVPAERVRPVAKTNPAGQETSDSEEIYVTLKVVGAGLARTGTASLKLALEHLLGGPCYDMLEVFANLAHPGVAPRGTRAVAELELVPGWLPGGRGPSGIGILVETCCAISSAVRSVGTLVEIEVDIIRVQHD